MALLFNSTSYLKVNEAVVTSAPLTMVCWFKTPTLQTNVLMSITDGSASNRSFHISLRSGGELHGTTWNSDAGTAIPTESYSLNEWRHVAFVCRSASDRSIFLDGGARGDNTTSVTPPGLDTTTIGRLTRSGSAFNVVDTQVAEAAIWSAALDDEEIAGVALGRSPLGLTHRLSELRFYNDLLSLQGGRTIGPVPTPFGAPTASPHPRVWAPTGQRFLPFAKKRRRLLAQERLAATAGAAFGQAFVPGVEALAGQPTGGVVA